MNSFLTIAGLVLASGESRRFGRSNKLLARLGGEPIVRRTTRAYLDADTQPVFVVVGYQATAVSAALDGLAVRLIPNPDFTEGQSASLRHGIEALGDVAGAVIGVGDQPLLTPNVIRNLMSVYRMGEASIVAPRYAGRRGNPVLFDRSLFSELAGVSGDQGGRSVIADHQDMVAWVDVPDPAIGTDVDSRDEYRRLRARIDGGKG